MLLTRKSAGATTPTSRISRSASGVLGKTIDRRTFLKRSGLTLGAGAVAAQLPYAMVGKANAEATPAATGEVSVKRTKGRPRPTSCVHVGPLGIEQIARTCPVVVGFSL